MKNFFKREKIVSIVNNLKDSFLKFPLSFLSVFIIAWISEYLVFQNRLINERTINILSKILLSLVLYYFLSIWIYLLNNKNKLFDLKTCFLQIFWILISVFFYFSFPESLTDNFYFENLIYIFVSFIWAISFIFVSKYLLNKEHTNISYYSFFNWIYSKIFASVLVWFMMMLLWFIALWSIFSLFELKVFISEWKTFSTWFVFSIVLFAPIYFLYQINWDFHWLSDKIQENKFYNFVNNYLSIPFIIVYFVILYSYTIKVLFNFNSWPEGIISWMIILFSLFWYLIYIFSYIFEDKNNLVRIFRKIFPIAVILQTPMLFYAIYLRISQYDLTINRYLVVIFWIFLVFISLYLIFSKKKLLLSIPFVLTFFIIFISFSPFSIYKLPETRQLNLLKNDLTDLNIFINWKIDLKKFDNINKDTSKKIYKKIDYLCDFHSCYSLNPIFSDLIREIENEHKLEWWKTETSSSVNLYYRNNNYRWISNWELKSRLLEKLNISPYRDTYQNSNINFSLGFYNPNQNLIELGDYDYLLKLDNSYTRSHLFISSIDLDKNIITIYKNNWWNEEFDIKDELNKFYEENKSKIKSYNRVDMEKAFIIEKKWNKFDIKYILNNFSIKNPQSKEKIGNTYIDGYLLILEK